MSMNGVWLRHAFPGVWSSALGLVLCLVGIVVLALFSLINDPDAPDMTVRGAIILAMLWWLLLCPHLCRLAWQMVPARLPGIERTLLRGCALHLLLSIGLPLSALLLWQPAHLDITGMAAALWLGSVLGLLILSLPLILGIVPVLIVVYCDPWLGNPAFTAGLGGLAMLAGLLAWRWHLRRYRPLWLAPFAVLLDSSSIQALTVLPAGYLRVRASPALPTASIQPGNSQDVLGAVLGPACQTTRQLFGRRGQWLSWLCIVGVPVALGVAGFTQVIEPDRSNPVFIAFASAGLFVVWGRPAACLHALHSRGQASLAELYLLPGLPAREQLTAAVMKQLAHCLIERLTLVAIAFGALGGLNVNFNIGWLVGCLLLAALALPMGMFSIWLAWHKRGRSKSWAVVGLGFMALNVYTLAMLLTGARFPSAGWLAWGAWLGLALVIGALQYRRIVRH